MVIEENLNTPLVSIVVITYNSSKYVLETLESAKAQTYQNIELIVTDDCSSDNTVAVCEKWIKENKERFVRTELITVTKNTGIPGNCNRGVKAAQGEWVKIIAGDDALMFNYVCNHLDFVSNNSTEKIYLINSNMEIYQENFNANSFLRNENLENRYQSRLTAKVSEQFQIFLRKPGLHTPTLFIHSKLFKEVGFFNENYPLMEDLPWVLKVLESGYKLYFFKFTSVKYRKTSNSVQIKKNKDKIIPEFIFQRDRFLVDYAFTYLEFKERFYLRWLVKTRFLIKKFNLNDRNLINFVIIYLFIKLPEFLYLNETTKILKKNNKL